MKFTKMHGISNDYVYVNCFEESVPNPGKVAQFISDRHRGIGSDGLVLIMPSSSCDFRMRMFNADGSEAEMCGNASRCVGKYVYDNGLTTKTSLSLETKAGLRLLSLHLGADGKVASVTVDMGKPELTPALIPVSSKLTAFIDQPVKVLDQTYYMTAVSMGIWSRTWRIATRWIAKSSYGRRTAYGCRPTTAWRRPSASPWPTWPTSR